MTSRPIEFPCPFCKVSSFGSAVLSLKMPGPGHKKPSKVKAKRESYSSRGRDDNPASSSPQVDAYVGDIDYAVDWMTRVEILCRIFDIPG